MRHKIPSARSEWTDGLGRSAKVGMDAIILSMSGWYMCDSRVRLVMNSRMAMKEDWAIGRE